MPNPDTNSETRSRGSAEEPGSDLKVGTVLRVKWAGRFRVYLVTGVHLGAVTEEDIVSLRTLDLKDGHAYGKAVPELMVPLVMLLELSQNIQAHSQKGHVRGPESTQD